MLSICISFPLALNLTPRQQLFLAQIRDFIHGPCQFGQIELHEHLIPIHQKRRNNLAAQTGEGGRQQLQAISTGHAGTSFTLHGQGQHPAGMLQHQKMIALFLVL